MAGTQEREESVRHFVTKFRGLAIVWDLDIVARCTCGSDVKVSAAGIAGFIFSW